MDEQADVGPLVDVRDGAADADRVAARAFVLRERANRADGRERRQGGRRRLPARRAGMARTAMASARTSRGRGDRPRTGGIVAREKAEGIREKNYDGASQGAMMDTIVQDLRYALRSLFRHPSFAVSAAATLALGIGATTAIFTVVNAVVFRPLPVDRPDRLVAIVNQYTTSPRPSLNVSAQDFEDWKAQSRSFRVMARYQGGETSIMLGNTADYARGAPGLARILRRRWECASRPAGC